MWSVSEFYVVQFRDRKISYGVGVAGGGHGISTGPI